MARKAKKKDYVGTWKGGIVRRDSKGRDIFHILRQVNGRVYKYSTRCTDIEAALDALKHFEMDPSGWQPGRGSTGKEPLTITSESITRFLGAGANRTTRALIMRWWAKTIPDLDLRKEAAVDIVHQKLGATTNRNMKTSILKTYLRWLLKTERTLKIYENFIEPTLVVKPVEPTQWLRRKSRTHAELSPIRAKLSGWQLDAFDFHCATGWHSTEVFRFVFGYVDLKGVFHDGRIDGAVVETPRHKAGGTHRSELKPAALEAAKRLREGRRYSYTALSGRLKVVCKHLKAEGIDVPVTTPGCFRATVATFAITSKATMQEVATFLGHRDASTTAKYYAEFAIPAQVPTLGFELAPTPKAE